MVLLFGLQCVIVVFPDYTHLLFGNKLAQMVFGRRSTKIAQISLIHCKKWPAGDGDRNALRLLVCASVSLSVTL